MSDNSVAQDQLRAIIERIERLDEELKAINDDKREIYAEAKGNGFDVPALKQVLKLRRMDANERMERDAIVDLYMSALGMTPQPYDDLSRAPAGARAPARTRGSDQAQPLSAPTLAASQSYFEPQPEAGGESRADIIDARGIAVDGASGTSFAGTEGDEGQHPIQPETANEKVGAFPVHAAPLSGGGTGGDGFTENDGRVNANPSLGVTGGESAASHSILASPEPPSTLAGEGGGVNRSAAPLNNSSAGREVPRAPGATWLERCPTAPVRWHEFSRCFPELWGPGRAELSDDIRANGVKCSIVKIGDDVLDGRARYTIARELGIEYPVTEYAGSDPLADVIQWNLAARALTANERKAIANKLMKLPSVAHRASEIMEMLGLEAEVAA